MRSIWPAVLIFSVLFAACDHPPVPRKLPPDHNTLVNSNVKQDTIESSPQAARAPYELQFIDTMISHDEIAIDAAQLVATRADHSDLKFFAKSMIAARQKEMAQLRTWRNEWFGGAPQAVNMDLPGARDGLAAVDMEKLDSLKANQFDLEFIREMLPLEQGASMLAKDVLSKDVRGELKQLAQALDEEHEADIERMQGWQTEWAR